MASEGYLSKKYEKWNHFEDDSDNEDAEVPRVPTQFDTEGDAEIVVSTEMLLTPKQVETYRKLDKRESEIWQVVVRKLRVWSAASEGPDDGSDAVPCRPYCVLVNNLYPLGQVVSKKICDPPEVYPSPETILELTLQAMLDPPTSTPQHRPDKIVFPDKNFVGKLRKSYSALGIECSYLSESEGIDTYIQELSNHLIRKDLASVAEVSERPGMISGSGVTPAILSEFYQACAKYAKLEPWKHLAERQAIQVDAHEEIQIDKRHKAVRGTIFSSVIATPTPDNGQIQGMALFFTRADLERRVLPRGEKLALMENPSLRRCGFCDKKAAAGAELKRCTQCQCVFYCGAACQRSHWKDHKIGCVAPSAATTDEKTIVWGAKEISILFGPLTAVPFDDLDAIDKHGFSIATPNHYPSAVVFKNGDPSVPEVSDLFWLMRGLQAQVHLLETHPLFIQRSMVSMLGLEDEESANQEQEKIELKCKTLGLDDQLVIRNSAVLTTQDVVKLRELVERQKARAASADSADENGEEQGDAANAADGSCVVM